MPEDSLTNPNPPTATDPPEQTPTNPPQGDPPPPEVMPDATPDDLRAEVRRLRDEAAASRVGSRRAEALADRLVTAYAAGTRRLADPTDLRPSEDLLDADGLPDRAKVVAAVEALLTAKPHLASRTPRGDVGQGAQGEPSQAGLLDLMRG